MNRKGAKTPRFRKDNEYLIEILHFAISLRFRVFAVRVLTTEGMKWQQQT